MRNLNSFNPKREARPSQTHAHGSGVSVPELFQSQTGSQALSDHVKGLIFHRLEVGFNPKREARPSQTHRPLDQPVGHSLCFNPKREARPSQTYQLSGRDALIRTSFNPKREARPSQT